MELWQWIVSICAGIVTLCTLGEKVWKYTRPVATASENLKDTLGDVALLKTSYKNVLERVERIEAHQSNDLKALQDHTKANKVICNALLALLDQGMTNHPTDQLKDAKDKIQSYLIER